MKKVLKWVRNIVLILVIFILLLVAFSQTRIFKNFLRNFIVEKANEQIVGAEFHLNRIEGNFFSGIVLQELAIHDGSAILFSLKKLKVSYKLLPLIRKKVIIEQIFLDELIINLEQHKNGEWNLATLIPAEADKHVKEEKEPQPFLWKISLHDFSLRNGIFSISMAEDNSFIPQKIDNLAIQLSAFYSEKEAELRLQNFHFSTHAPDFTLNQLQFHAELRDELAKITGFELKTKENTFRIEAEFDLEEEKPESFSFAVAPLKLDEFSDFLPEMPIRRLPEMNILAQFSDEQAELQVSVSELNQSLQVNMIADSVFSNLRYYGKVQIEKCNMSDWLADEKMDSNINLILSFEGDDINPETANLTMDLLLSSSRFQDKSIDKMQLHAEKTAGKAVFQSTISANFGSLVLQGTVNTIFSEPDYNVMLDLHNFNLAPLVADDSLQSDITLSLVVQGQGFEPKTLTSDVSLSAQPSSFQSIEIDSLAADFFYDKERYEIRNFLLSASLLDFSINGSGKLDGENELFYQIRFKDLKQLENWLEFDQIAATGGLNGTVQGKLDSLLATTHIQINDFIFDDISLQEISGTISVERIKGEMNADVEIAIHDIEYEDFAVEKLELSVKGNEKRLDNRLYAQADSLSLLLRNWVEPDSLITIGLTELAIDYGSLNVRTTHENCRIIIDKNRYIVQDLFLTGEESLLSIDGFIAPEDEQDMRLSLQNFDISLVQNFVDLPFRLQGNLSFDSEIKGRLSELSLHSNLLIDEIKLDENKFEKIVFQANLAEKLMQADFAIIRNEREKITGSAKLPFFLADSVGVVPTDEQLQVVLAVNDLDVSFLSEFSEQIDRLNGVLDIEFVLSNTLENPELNGNIKLSKGRLDISEFGLQYPELRFDLSTKNRKITLNELYLKGGDGFLKLHGWAELERTVQDGIKEFDFSILANQFLAAGKRELEVLTNMDLALQGTMENPVFSGDVSITRARIDLDALPGSQAPVVNVNEPLLVQAMQQEAVPEGEERRRERKQPDIIDKLTGAMQIKIPRNTWIKNKDLNVEISGDLEIVKTGKDFEIFGYVSTIRGSYSLYGRKFDLRDGTVTFRGGTEINPLLDISIKHIFRDINRQKRELEIALGGEALQPAIMFYLDGNEITEADAISYLLFGRSSDQISQGERSEVAGKSESSLAKSMIARQIGGQIATEIGKTLKLDVVEFSGGDDWKQASILVGKYITNDLFLSYQKEFSLGQSKEYVPDVISLEYEINKFLSLQATRGDEKVTGIDIFWKYQRK